MKILITGANGYIGRSLANDLSKFHNVITLTRNIADLTNKKEVNAFFEKSCQDGNHFDWVIHSAVEGGSRLKKDDDSTIINNLKMYYNLLDNSKFFNRFISFGSGAEISFPDTPYGFSKKIIADSISEKNGFFNVRIYGLFDHEELSSRFIKSNILRYINKRPMEIHADKYMDFFYMEDFKSLINYYLSSKDPSKITSCVYKEKYRLSEIAKIINQLDFHKVDIITSSKKDKDYISQRDDCSDYPYNNINLIGFIKGIETTYSKLKI